MKWALALVGVLGVAACTPSPFFRGHYSVTMPASGAPHRVSANNIGAQFGVVGHGSGARFGGVWDIRARLPGDDVVGGSAGISGVGVFSPAGRSSPFLVTTAGLGLYGATGLRGEEEGTIDIGSPHVDASVAFPAPEGSTISIGISLDMLHRIDRDDVLLLGLTLGVGVFDPRVTRADGVFGRLAD